MIIVLISLHYVEQHYGGLIEVFPGPGPRVIINDGVLWMSDKPIERTSSQEANAWHTEPQVAQVDVFAALHEQSALGSRKCFTAR